MWFAWDGTHLLFTHTNVRQKFANLTAEPRVAVSMFDPDSPYRSLEVRGTVESIDPDPEGAFYSQLQQRYGVSFPVVDQDVRVILRVKPTKFIAVNRGLVVGAETDAYKTRIAEELS